MSEEKRELANFGFRLTYRHSVNQPILLWRDDEEPGIIRYGFRDSFTAKTYLVTIQDTTEEETP